MAGADFSRRGLLIGASASVLLGRRAFASDGLTLRGATLLTHDGARLSDHGLRVEGGRIVEVGPSGRFSSGEDLGGRWIVPGFTDAGCMLGLLEIGLEASTHDDSESSAAVVPDARARDGYNPRSELIPIARVNGVTGAIVHPATKGLVSGQAALFRTVGDTVEAALVKAPVALCVNLGRAATGSGNGAPVSRMGVAMKLRELLEGVKLPDESPAADEPKRKKKDAKPDNASDAKPDAEVSPSDRSLRDLKRGELPALVFAERADDLLFALEFARAWGLKLVLLGGAEAHLVADAIAAASVPVFLGPLTTQPDSFDHRYARYENAARLHAAGVRLGFRTGVAHQVRNLPYDAGVAVAHGLPFEAAIRGLTVGPWDALGLDGGRLAEGAPATFFVSDGDPLQPRTAIRRVLIDGRETSMETRQSRLHDAFRELR